MLLLFAARFMRIGIERLWSQKIRLSLSQTSFGPSLLFKGTFLGFVMQGATVVMLMAAGLVGAGVIPLNSAILLAIGADLGSAFAVRFLTLPVSAIGPAAILIGGWLYLNLEDPAKRNLGRVILGLGLVFLSLTLIRDAVAPLRDFSGAAAVLAYMNADPITALITGIVLTLLMHSSLATVLTAVALGAHGQLGAIGGLAFILGCNMGGALLPLWLMRHEKSQGLTVAKTVAALRCGLAVVLLMVLIITQDQLQALSAYRADNVMLAGHVGFNLLLLLLAPLGRPVSGIFAQTASAETVNRFTLENVNDDPDLILSALQGQVSRMVDTFGQLFKVATSDLPDRGKIVSLEKQINESLTDLRLSYATLPDMPADTAGDIHTLLDFAIRVEFCGDVISGKYATIRFEAVQGEYAFTEMGQAEIDNMCAEVRKGIHLAQTVFWRGDVALARKLAQHKQKVADLEQESRRLHLQRVRNGNLTSLVSSNHHLELIAALKTVNSKLATIGYAVLDEHGGLKKSRLKSKLSLADKR
ncbi:MAG: Na/Pi cotransporter family protein [Rhodobacteraceae bacterium]|nr:Na/Pi cotransporter family protein [Paracoccaceae bacterium]